MAKYEIEIPDGVLPEHCVPVEYRRPMSGDLVECDGAILSMDGTDDLCYLILRPVEPKRESRWINIYPFDSGVPLSINSSRDGAEFWLQPKRLGVVRIDYENGVPVSATLEPKEQ